MKKKKKINYDIDYYLGADPKKHKDYEYFGGKKKKKK